MITLTVRGENFTFGSLDEATLRVRAVFDQAEQCKRAHLDKMVELGRWLVALRATRPENEWRLPGGDGWRAHLARYQIHYKTAQRAMKLVEWDDAGRPAVETRVSQRGEHREGSLRSALAGAGAPVEGRVADDDDYVGPEDEVFGLPSPFEDDDSSLPAASDPDISGATSSGRVVGGQPGASLAHDLSPPAAGPALVASPAASREQGGKGASGSQLTLAVVYAAIDKVRTLAADVQGMSLAVREAVAELERRLRGELNTVGGP